MQLSDKKFHLIWFTISFMVALFVVYQVSSQRIELPANNLSIQSINQFCKDQKDPSSCTVSSPRVNIDLSELIKQIESFDSFFPLSAIAELNLTIYSSLDSNAFLEITQPEFSEKMNDIKIYCLGDTSPRFYSKQSPKEFPNVRPVSVNTKIYNYFACANPTINLAYNSEGKKIEVAPNQYVKFVLQGDKLIITQNSFVIIELNCLTKIIIFIIMFFLGLGAGIILNTYLIKIDLLQSNKI